VTEICALLGCYAALSGNPLPTFRYNHSAFKGQEVLTLEDETERSFIDTRRWDREVVPKRRYKTTTQRCVISQKSADLIYIAAEA
jgi:hypothetical protein